MTCVRGRVPRLAPLVIKNTLITGSSGGEFGVRGHIDCWDLKTGEQHVAHLHRAQAG